MLISTYLMKTCVWIALLMTRMRIARGESCGDIKTVGVDENGAGDDDVVNAGLLAVASSKKNCRLGG